MGRIGFGGGLVMKRWDDSGEGGVKYGVDIMYPRALETWKVNYSRLKNIVDSQQAWAYQAYVSIRQQHTPAYVHFYSSDNIGDHALQ